MDTTSTITLPITSDFTLRPKSEALNRQQVQILFSDIDNLRSLHEIYQTSQKQAQFSILYRRVSAYLQRMNELASYVVLDAEQLKKFQENKQYLDQLAFELAGSSHSGEKWHHHVCFAHGQRGVKLEKKLMKHQHKWLKKEEKRMHH